MRVHPSVSPSPWLWIHVQVCAQFNLFFFWWGVPLLSPVPVESCRLIDASPRPEASLCSLCLRALKKY